MALIRSPEARDVLLSLAAFTLPTTVIFLYCLGREWRRLRREREALLQEEEASAAEGYPPPGPPTTDSLTD
jgi:hypothetical protein